MERLAQIMTSFLTLRGNGGRINRGKRARAAIDNLLPARFVVVGRLFYENTALLLIQKMHKLVLAGLLVGLDIDDVPLA